MINGSIINFGFGKPFYLTVFTYFAVAAVGDAKSYVIISKLPSDVYGKFVEDKSSGHVSGLTFVVTGIIHLGGGRITEGVVTHWIYCV